MPFSNEQLNNVYDRTNGRCHICGRKRSFSNYGRVRAKGAWHVDHSVPRARGGTNHGNNLFVACVGCNCSKGARSTRSARRYHSRSAAPLSRTAQKDADFASALGAAALAITGILVLSALQPQAKNVGQSAPMRLRFS